jgi:hypothetical protein
MPGRCEHSHLLATEINFGNKLAQPTNASRQNPSITETPRKVVSREQFKHNAPETPNVHLGAITTRGFLDSVVAVLAT